MEENNQNSGVSPELQETQQTPFDNHMYDEQPNTTGKGMAIAALVLSILSILCCCIGVGIIFGIVGLILGIVALRKNPDAVKGLAIASIIIAAIGIVSSGYMIINYAVVATMIDWSQVDFNNPEATQKYLDSLKESLQYIKLLF